MTEFPPRMIAVADQELAAADDALDVLAELWLERQAEWDTQGLDRMRRVAIFMVGEIAPRATVSGLLVLLAIAAERLSKGTHTPEAS